MKFTLAAALLSIATAVSATESAPAQSLPELFSRIPTCANSCISEAMPGLCPSVESYWCRCHNSVKGRLMSKTFDCAIEACGGMDGALAYQEAANSVCDDIKEVTLRGQKHVELRQAPSGSASVMPSGSAGARGSGSGSGSGSRAATSTPTTTAPAPASSNGASSTSGNILMGSVAGLAIISFIGMLA